MKSYSIPHLTRWMRFRRRVGPRATVDSGRELHGNTNHRPSSAPSTGRPRTVREPSLRRLEGIAKLLSVRPERLAHMYAVETRRLYATAVRGLLESLRVIDTRTTSHRVGLRERGARLKGTIRTNVRDLLAANLSLEQQVRTLAWTLDRGYSKNVRVGLIDIGAHNNAEWRRLGLDPARSKPTVVWIVDRPVPAQLRHLAAERRILLVADEQTSGLKPLSGCVLVGANAALIERPDDAGDACHIRLPGIAAFVQAIISDYAREAWRPIPTPVGFVGLDRDVGINQEKELALTGRIAAVYTSGDGERLAISSRIIPKTMRVCR